MMHIKQYQAVFITPMVCGLLFFAQKQRHSNVLVRSPCSQWKIRTVQNLILVSAFSTFQNSDILSKQHTRCNWSPCCVSLRTQAWRESYLKFNHNGDSFLHFLSPDTLKEDLSPLLGDLLNLDCVWELGFLFCSKTMQKNTRCFYNLDKDYFSERLFSEQSMWCAGKQSEVSNVWKILCEQVTHVFTLPSQMFLCLHRMVRATSQQTCLCVVGTNIRAELV